MRREKASDLVVLCGLVVLATLILQAGLALCRLVSAPAALSVALVFTTLVPGGIAVAAKARRSVGDLLPLYWTGLIGLSIVLVFVGIVMRAWPRFT